MTARPYTLHDLSLLVGDQHTSAHHRLRDDISEHGFAVFEDDGIDPALLERLQYSANAFFAQPLKIKQQYEDAQNGRQRGYSSPRIEHAMDQNPEDADLKEFWQQGPEGPDLLPNPPTHWPDFDQYRREYLLALRQRCDTVLRAIAPLLNVDSEWLVRYGSGGDDIMRMLRYFDLSGENYPSTALRSAPHTDINLVTLLKTIGEGLVVRSKSGQEVEVDIGPRQLVVQMGDFMAVLSGGLLPATTHWVKNSPGVRNSIALFNHPKGTHPVAVLPEFVQRGFMWDACTERAATHKRLVEIGILRPEDQRFTDEFVSKGYLIPDSWVDMI